MSSAVVWGNGHMHAVMIGRQDNLFILAFDAPILPHLELYGELPIPPYFERHADDTDNTRYQTVFLSVLYLIL